MGVSEGFFGMCPTSNDHNDPVNPRESTTISSMKITVFIDEITKSWLNFVHMSCVSIYMTMDIIDV